MDNLNDRQTARENEMVERGRDRTMRAIERAIERGDAHETPAGKALAKRAIEPMVKGIVEYVTREYSKRTPPTSAGIILKDLNPELCAYVTTRACIGSAVKGYSLKATALAIADSIEVELLGERFEKLNPGLYAAVISKAKSRALTPARQGNAVKNAARKFSVCEVRTWTQHDRLKLGVVLIDLFAKTIGTIKITTRIRHNQTSHIMEFTDEIHEWFQKYNGAASLARPIFLPTLVPPQRWSSVKGTPYFSDRVRRATLLSRSFPGQVEALEKADLSRVYKALNGLQETAWKVNERVLAVMREAWDRGMDLPCMPPRDLEPIPETPEEVQNDVKGGEIRKEWRQRVRAIHERNAKVRSSRFEFARNLAIAQDNRNEEAIYFPHRLDFRGRAYAAGTSLNPQGSDESKALIHFSEGKPLGERGRWWLGVHGANLFGNDKVSLEDRFQWALANFGKVYDVAQNPLENLWWTEADSPWCFLAWCFEWAEARWDGDGYLSHLPIALDGSCNGIQHFSAMLRDPVGGAAVNLIPADKPSDIYGRVAERTVEKLKELAVADQPESWMADAWVRFGINRKITKRPVMVLPYGGTFRSCSEYVKEAVQERFKAGDENPFGDDLNKALTLLAQHVWAAIGDVVIAAREAMSWLQSCARVMVAAGKPIRWTTPSGFVVIQDYRKFNGQRIQTRFAGQLIFMSSVELGEEIDRSKQASAVSPNFVHSLDASALALTICRGLDEGITSWAMIHDSYGTHAADTDKLAAVLREEFVTMYSTHDVLQEFRDELASQLPEHLVEKLPPVPQKGSLEIELVTKSPYFFA